MPKVVIPLVSEYNTRGLFATADKDARLINGLYVPVVNQASRSAAWYVEKRPGWITHQSTGTSLSGLAVLNSDTQQVVSAYRGGNVVSAIFEGSTNCGSISGESTVVNSFVWGSLAYVMIGNDASGSAPYSGWYLGENASAATTFQGTITSGQKTISGVSSTTGIYVGQLLTQTALTAGTRIASISGTDVITDTNAISTTAAATITRQAVSKILDADFPATPPYIYCELDGYVFVSDTANRRIYNSDLNAVHSWGASNYITVDSAVGELLSVARYKNYIVALCTRGIQFFYNAGNTSGSPLSRVPQGTITGIGTSGTNFFVPAWDNLYWFFSTPNTTTGAGIYCLDGLTPKKISTPTIDNLFTANPTYLGKMTIGGRRYIYIFGTPTFLYDVGAEKWQEVSFSSTYVIDDYYGVNATAGRGIIYRMDNTSYQDASTTYTLTVQTPRMNFGTNNRKRIKKVSLIADNQASGSAYLSWSTDDYATFGTARTLDMTANEKSARNLGAARNWAFRVIHYDNTAFRAEGLEVEYDELDN